MILGVEPILIGKDRYFSVSYNKVLTEIAGSNLA